MLIDSHCHLDFPELAADRIGVLAREDFVFDDCKDPYKAVIDLIPLAGGARVSIPVAPKKGILGSFALYLQ